ncbi:AraC family transcriptional regulator [Xanthobacter flavus]|uniref:AraC family transcriptional regulator n=1 Tax=Xanthobacter flavus TaxID=281 RepID=UPI0037262D6E
MDSTLLDAARRYTRAHADANGVAATPIPGLTLIRQTAPTALQYAINKPLIALVLQGTKRVAMGGRTFDFGVGESLLITADVPTASQITRAQVSAPYISLVVDLDPAVIESLVVEMGAAPFAAEMPVRVDVTDAEVAETALRLIRLCDRPAAMAVLKAPLLRELHFWLLCSRHGGAIRALGVADSHSRRIARVVALLRTSFDKPLRVHDLAAAAGMSVSALHEHFRAITSLTPLQFQKQLRLIEARRIMLAEGATIADVAYLVGYESVPQFTREYGRLFGQPPGRDMRAAKGRMQPAA